MAVAVAVNVAAEGPAPLGWMILLAAATGDWNGLGWLQAKRGMGWVGPAATRGWKGMGRPPLETAVGWPGCSRAP
jgi:hypothetical protein